MTATYKTGTAAVTNGSAAVVGTGTAWAVALIVGGMFSCDGLAVPISAVVDDTHLTLDYPWPGTTGSGQSYSILRENSDAANLVDLYDKLTQLLIDLSLAGIHPDNSGSIAKRNALTLTAANDGYLYLQAELGVAFAFYRWDGPSLAWVGPFAVASATTTAAGVQSIVGGNGVAIDNTNPNIPVVSLADMASATIKGRASAGTGAPENLSMGQLKSLLLSSVVIREVLTANRTYYVRADGSDSNTGLANTSGGAFLTIQKALNIVAGLDVSTFNVTIQCGAGTFAGATVSSPWVGSGTVTLLGDTTTPANVSVGSITVTGGGSRLVVAGLKLTGTLLAQDGGNIACGGKMEFSGSSTQIQAQGFGAIINFANAVYTISAGGNRHVYALIGGYVQLFGATITLTGTPAFAIAFVDSQRGGFVNFGVNTFTGSAAGSRYAAASLGTINTAGGGASYLPGSTAGTGTNPATSPYGLYI